MLSLGLKMKKKNFKNFLSPKFAFLNFWNRNRWKNQLCLIEFFSPKIAFLNFLNCCRQKKVNFVQLLGNFFWCIVGIYKALRIIGWAQNSIISYRLGVMAKKWPFLAIFGVFTQKWCFWAHLIIHRAFYIPTMNKKKSEQSDKVDFFAYCDFKNLKMRFWVTKIFKFFFFIFKPRDNIKSIPILRKVYSYLVDTP